MSHLSKLDKQSNKVTVKDINELPSLLKSDVDTHINTRIEYWERQEIRFIEQNNKWYGNLKDIGKILKSKSNDYIDISESIVYDGEIYIEEKVIYDFILVSDLPIANKFRRWTSLVLTKLRNLINLEEYQCFKLLEDEYQNQIDNILDTIYWDDNKKCLMRTITIQGGDTRQEPI
ncbi:MAG: hypothetical protein IJ094_12890 [Bacilli bacterium]|nr:hypothetical protein [Bacilli bacterium]